VATLEYCYQSRGVPGTPRSLSRIQECGLRHLLAVAVGFDLRVSRDVADGPGRDAVER